MPNWPTLPHKAAALGEGLADPAIRGEAIAMLRGLGSVEIHCELMIVAAA
jgi:hypothetical protein